VRSFLLSAANGSRQTNNSLQGTKKTGVWPRFFSVVRSETEFDPGAFRSKVLKPEQDQDIIVVALGQFLNASQIVSGVDTGDVRIVFCQEGDDFWKLSPEELCQRGVSELIKMKIIDPESPILDYHVEKVPKAYPAYFDTYADIRKLIDYLDTIGNLYCIGRNGQHRYNNMDHSMLTAFAAVEHILSGKDSDRSKIWTVNTEKEYHEEQRSQSGH